MKYLYIILCVLIINTLFAQQQTAEFETTIYFEDTLGNKDSVIIGYDSNKMPYILDSTFGEFDITGVPWDSIFEARVMPGIASENKQTKKAINAYVCDGTNISRNWTVFTVAIRLKTPFAPLIVRWNPFDFSSDLCRIGSFIVRSPLYFQYQYPTTWGFGERYMANSATLGTNWTTGIGTSHGLFEIDEAGDTVLINSFSIAIAQNYPVSTTQQELERATKVFPNPTTDKFTILLPENYYSESVQVFDITGRQIYQNTEQNNQIEVPSSTWSKGVYFYRVELEDGIFVNGKILKN